MPRTLEVPEGQLIEIARTVYRSMPATGDDAVQRQRRLIATTWLRQLVEAVHNWNLEFIAVLGRYPGFGRSMNPSDYAEFFRELDEYEHQLRTRGGGIKDRLCRRLIQLNKRLDKDFGWLAQADSGAFSQLKRISNDSYQNEVGVIELARKVIAEIRYPSDLPRDLQGEAISDGTDYLAYQIARTDAVRKIITQYAATSRQIVDKLRDFSASADAQLLSLEEFAKRESNYSQHSDSDLLETETWIEQMSNRSHIVNTRLYTILAFCFGVIFLGVLLALTAAFPNPTKAQLKFWASILALSAGAVSTVMSGLINVRLSFGKQLVVGATGAFAVFVITFFWNPAILE
ncbi:hypothetical protein I6F36_35245 [Bradyrhizobium sp. BRP19]|uniref:hypothetical protein n=1 Tax=Bradyrhizobium sp. BRP19 TaxID=2793823 RepID=UPI001CD2F0AA|nr:hypothetical protein [Bradyrhizobium sp. BRP19]MCA1552054.1 hypothetical protein [Bradyrhizobium sp. BRP19]